jgi:two-component system, NarL family, nitrate/nitrite response regulator NarL
MKHARLACRSRPMPADEPLTAPIRALVAASEPLFRDGLARSVRRDPDLRLVAELGDNSAAVDTIRRLVPDVAVLDAEPGVVRIVEAVAQHALGTRIVLLAAAVRPGDVLEAVAAGTHGYLSKRVNGDIVCDAIRRVANGDAVLCEEAQTAIAGEVRRRDAAAHRLLPPRELEVLKLVQRGLNHRQIGRQLHIAPTTVKSHCARTRERLGVGDSMGAVVVAMRRGLLD